MISARPIAAVTGASSGIGAVFARKLAARGYDLILIARRKERLDELAAELGREHGCSAESVVADLSMESDTTRVAEHLRSTARLAMLVNNAGFGVTGRFHATPVEHQEQMHRVHVMATVRLTHAVLKQMVDRNAGSIINVASVAAFACSEGNVSYCATKSWMATFSEGLFLEMKSVAPGVRIQALCPGFTYSEFHDVMGVDRKKIASSLWMSAGFVVDASLRGLESNSLYVVPGWRYKLLVAVLTKLPSGMRTWAESRNPQSRDRV